MLWLKLVHENRHIFLLSAQAILHTFSFIDTRTLVVSIFVPWCFCIYWQQALAVCSYLWQPMCELHNAQLCHVTNVQYVRSSWEVNSRTAGKQRTITSTRFSSQCHVCSDAEEQTDSQVNVFIQPQISLIYPKSGHHLTLKQPSADEICYRKRWSYFHQWTDRGRKSEP